MPIIKLKDNESFDSGLRRFKRSCDKAGVISEIRKREFYEKPTSVRKRKAAAAVKRQAKRRKSVWLPSLSQGKKPMVVSLDKCQNPNLNK